MESRRCLAPKPQRKCLAHMRAKSRRATTQARRQTQTQQRSAAAAHADDSDVGAPHHPVEGPRRRSSKAHRVPCSNGATDNMQHALHKHATGDMHRTTCDAQQTRNNMQRQIARCSLAEDAGRRGSTAHRTTAGSGPSATACAGTFGLVRAELPTATLECCAEGYGQTVPIRVRACVRACVRVRARACVSGG